VCGVLEVVWCGGGQFVGVGPVRDRRGYMGVCFIIVVFLLLLLFLLFIYFVNDLLVSGLLAII
jgi:Flp pilus assembly protein TadG